MDPMTIALLGSALVGLVSTGYNLYNNYRDRKYQEDLQDTMFDREDNSIQRRMKDLEAAGINPNLAAGSGAAAGNVVSRSQTNDVDFGSMIDLMQATGQLAQQKLQRENLKTENEILHYQRNQEAMQNTLDKINVFNALGLPYGIQVDVKDGDLNFDFRVNKNNRIAISDSTPITKLFNSQADQVYYQTDMLKKDNDWYTADKISGLALNTLGLFAPKFSFTKRLR